MAFSEVCHKQQELCVIYVNTTWTFLSVGGQRTLNIK